MDSEFYSVDQTNTVGCGCAACHSRQPDTYVYDQDGQSSSNEATYAPTQEADPTEFAEYLVEGFWNDVGGGARSWNQNNITFSISNGYNASQKDGIQEAFDLWSDVADITFTEVSSGADISLVVGNDGRAYSSSTTSAGAILSNTISIDTSTSSWDDIGDLGDYAFMSVLHEIGHSLGLGHTGNYNGSASYNNDAQWTNDTHQMTVMSYFSDSNVGSDHWNGAQGWQYSATPMLIDILAIQMIYGANYSTRNGDTIYGFNSNAGGDQYDFSITQVPIAIWDGGGTDTIDLSGFSQNNTLYLTEGEFSSVGEMTNNLIIAHGVGIENAIGGTGNDTIYANDLSNNIDGGAGDDAVVYNYNVDDFVYNFISNTVVALTHILENFTDTLSNIENFIFSDASYDFSSLENLYSELETVGLRFFWDGGGLYKHYSIGSETTSFDATTMNYNGGTGDQITYVRSGYQSTITVHNNNAPDSMLIAGSINNDVILINGTHNNMTTQVYGGDGDDEITVSLYGNGYLYGENGDDTITANDASDRIWGGSGNDTIFAGDGYDRIFGDEGNDTIHGEGGNDRIYAGMGNDTITGGAGQDFIYGQDGDDTIEGGDLADFLHGGAGRDLLFGDNHNDRLYGGGDDDTIYGGAGADNLFGDTGDDILYGENGSDRIVGGAGTDIIFGGNGNDTVYGGDDLDIISGGNNNDILNGENGNDLVYGDAGDDRLYGGDGQDLLIGGAGTDFLYGGSDTNRDIFGFSNDENSEDRIYEFTFGFDAINITDLLTGYNHGVSDINDFVNIAHTGSRFDVQVDRDGGGDNYVSTARVFTNISDSITAQDLVDIGGLVVNETLA